MATWNLGNHLSICLKTQGNQEKPVSRWPVAGPSEYWLLASSPACKVKTAIHTHSTTNTPKMTTIHTRQLQQYTRPTNSNYKQDWLMVSCYHADIIVYQKKSYPEVVLTAPDPFHLLFTIFLSSFMNQHLHSQLHIACLSIAVMLRIYLWRFEHRSAQI